MGMNQKGWRRYLIRIQINQEKMSRMIYRIYINKFIRDTFWAMIP